MAGRVQLVDHSAAVGTVEARNAATASGPVEVACRVADHTVRLAPIGPAREVIQHRLMAGRIQLENDAAPAALETARYAAQGSGPIEVALRVANHTRVGRTTVGPTREGVKRLVVAGSIQLVHYALVRCAATTIGSIEVAGRVADHAVGGSGCTGRGEAVQHRLLARRIQLEHGAALAP